ncbi:hypothetical protein HK405_013110, partial [Cladochytrium tenue]
MATGSRLEVVVCDAGSTDETVSSVRRLQAAIAAARIISAGEGEGYGQRSPMTLDFDLQLLEFQRGTSRATRMNAGILRSTGHVVLFLYSGIVLPRAFDEVIMLTMTAPRTRLAATESSFFSSLLPGQRARPKSPHTASVAPPLQSREALPQWLVSPPKSSSRAAFMGGAFPLASESASHDPFLPVLLRAANVVSALLALPLHPAQPFYLSRADAVDAGGFRDQPVVDAQELLHRIARLPPRRPATSAASTAAAPASPSAPRPGSPGYTSWFSLRHRRSGSGVAAAGQTVGGADKSGPDDFAAGGSGGAQRLFIAPEPAFAALIAAGAGAACLGPARVFGSLDSPPPPPPPRASGGGRSAPAALAATEAAGGIRGGLVETSSGGVRTRTPTPPPGETRRASSAAQGFFPDEEGAEGEDDDGGDGGGGFIGSRAGPAGAAGVRTFVAHCLCLFLVAGLGMAPDAAFRHVVGDDAAVGGVGADARRRLETVEAAAAVGTGRERRRSAGGARAAARDRRGTTARRRGGELQKVSRAVIGNDDDDDEGGAGSGSRSADGAGFDVDTDLGASEYYLSGRDDSSAWAEPGVLAGRRQAMAATSSTSAAVGSGRGPGGGAADEEDDAGSYVSARDDSSELSTEAGVLVADYRLLLLSGSADSGGISTTPGTAAVPALHA